MIAENEMETFPTVNNIGEQSESPLGDDVMVSDFSSSLV